MEKLSWINKIIITFYLKLSFIFFKRETLINRILTKRNYAVTTVKNFMKEIFKINRDKKKLILYSILKNRREKASYIQNIYKAFYFRKEVKKLISKVMHYYCITSEIKNVKKITLKVFLKNQTIKKLNFEYCKIRKIFVLYIDRKIEASIYRVNFIADDRVVIDPKYRTQYNENGEFYNLIDFSYIKHKEELLFEDKSRIIKFYVDRSMKERELKCFYLSKQYITSSNSDSSLNSASSLDIDHKDNKQKQPEFTINKSTYKNHSMSESIYKHDILKKRNSIELKNINLTSFPFKQISNPIGRNKTCLSLISPMKSILRSPNSSSKGSLPGKKVKFSVKVDFSF